MAASGVQRLMEQERKCQALINEAKKTKQARIKAAKEAAQKEIDAERAKIQAELAAIDAASTTDEDAVKATKEKEATIAHLRQQFNANKGLVLDVLFSLCVGGAETR